MELALIDLLDKLQTISVKYNTASIECFRRLPTKKQLPQYYHLVKNPIDIETIEKRIKKNKYKSALEIFNEVEVMSKNALIYNDSSSLLYESADKFAKYLSKNRKRLVSHMQTLTNEQKSSLETPVILSPISHGTRKRKSTANTMISELKKQLYNLLDNVNNYTVPNNDTTTTTTNTMSLLCDITNTNDTSDCPTSLDIIRTKIDEGTITTNEDLFADLNSLVDYAMKGHKPSTELYKNVKLLKNYVKTLHSTLEHQTTTPTNAETISHDQFTTSSSPTPPPSKGRISRKSTSGGASNLNNSTKLQSPKTKNKNSKHDESLFDPQYVQNLSDDHKKLYSKLNSSYKALRDIKTENGTLFACYDFLFCPAAFTNPEYYEVIEHPIDMSTIFKRLKRYQYTKVEQFLGDFKLLFNNIKSLTLKNSHMQKNAIKLENKLLEEFHMKSLKQIPDGEDKFAEIDPFESSSDDVHHYLNVNLNEKQALKSLLTFIPVITDYKGKILLASLHLDKILADIKKNQNATTVYDAFVEINSFLDSFCSKHPNDLCFHDDAVLFHYELYRYIKPFLDSKSVIIDPLAKLSHIIRSVWDGVLAHEDNNGHIYHYSMSCYSLEKSIKKQDETITRTITFSFINFCVINNLYTNFETFQNDFIDFCFRVRSSTNVYSEPHRDVVELLLYFVKRRDELIADIDTNALTYSAAVLNSQLETDPFSYPAKQRANIIERYFVIEIEKLNLCQNYYTDYADTEFSEDCYDGINIGSSPFRKGDSIRIRDSDLNWLLLGFIENTNENKFCVVAQLDHYQDLALPRRYTRTYLPNEFIVIDTLMIYPVTEIESKIENIFYTQYYRQNSRCEKASFFDHFYSYKLDEYFFIHQFFVDPPPLPTPAPNAVVTPTKFDRSSNIAPMSMKSGSSGSNRLYCNRTITLKKNTPTSDVNETTLDDSFTVKNSLTINNTRSIEEITTGGVVADDGLIHYLQICSNDTFYRKDEFVYLYDKEDELTVGRIVDIWRDRYADATAYMFKAVILYFPDDLKHNTVRMFYPNEVFKTNVEVTQSIDCIYAHCSVLHPNYYYSEYPVTHNPQDVYVCESSVNIHNNHIRKHKPFRSAAFHAHPHMIYDESMSMEFDGDGDGVYGDNKRKIYKIPSPFLLREVVKINEKRTTLALQHSFGVDRKEELVVIRRKEGGERKQRRSVSSKKGSRRSIPSTPTKQPLLQQQQQYSQTFNNTIGDNEYIIDHHHHCICKWRNCDTQFKSNDLMMDHILTIHRLTPIRTTSSNFIDDTAAAVAAAASNEFAYVCRWKNCGHKKHSKFLYLHQLVQHIKHYHCSPNTLDQSVHVEHNQTLDSQHIYGAGGAGSIAAASANISHMDMINLSQNNPDIVTNTSIGKGKGVGMVVTNYDKNMDHFYQQVLQLKTLVGPFLTSVGDSVEELNSHVDTINKQLVMLHTTVVGQGQEIKQLKESQQLHRCCYSDDDRHHHLVDESAQIYLPSGVNYVNGASLSTNTNTTTAIHNGDGDYHQVSIMANLNFVESASADLLRHALQQSVNNNNNVDDANDSSNPSNQ